MKKLYKKIMFYIHYPIIYLQSWYKYKTEKCQHCGLYLHRFKGYHGAVDINQNISGSKRETAYLCNLCYHIARKTSWG